MYAGISVCSMIRDNGTAVCVRTGSGTLWYHTVLSLFIRGRCASTVPVVVSCSCEKSNGCVKQCRALGLAGHPKYTTQQPRCECHTDSADYLVLITAVRLGSYMDDYGSRPGHAYAAIFFAESRVCMPMSAAIIVYAGCVDVTMTLRCAMTCSPCPYSSCECFMMDQMHTNPI